jgi:PAS domain-containing protein
MTHPIHLLGAQAATSSFPVLHPAADGASVLVTIAIWSVVIGFICSSLAVWNYTRLVKARRHAQYDRQRALAVIRFRDAVLSASEEYAVSFSNDPNPLPGADAANALLKKAIEGPDAKFVASAVDELVREGTSFSLTAHCDDASNIAIRGKLVAGRAVVFAKSFEAADTTIEYAAVLDAMPVPIWVRGRDLALRWCNQAYLNVCGAANLSQALKTNAMIQRGEVDIARAALQGAGSIDAVRYTLVDGTRRAYSFNLSSLSGTGVAGIAFDITEKAKTEAKFRLAADANADLLDGLSTAIATFDAEQRLTGRNVSCESLWAFTDGWLDTHPRIGDILDRLRIARHVPEQSNFQSWKAERLQVFAHLDKEYEEFWHLPGGRSLRLIARPHLLGGFTLMFEDISEKLRLESSFKLLTRVQRATLDAVSDGIAIFGPDSRLALYNKEFARLWKFTEDDLAGQPHLTKIVRMAEARVGHDGIWSIVSTGILSDEPERCNEWGKASRADGRLVSVAMARLPDGATVVTFSDLTDLERFGATDDQVYDVA